MQQEVYKAIGDINESEFHNVSAKDRRRMEQEVLREQLQAFPAHRSCIPLPPPVATQQQSMERLSRPVQRLGAKRRFDFVKTSGGGSVGSPHSPVSEDVLLRPAAGEKRFWIYLSYKLSRQDAHPMRQIKKLIDAALQRTSSPSFGLLFDIVTTSSTIATGQPHQVAEQVYTYVDESYAHKDGLKFVFVGITDNDNCRAARDVFCREDISGHPKKQFEAIDNNHMYAVFPHDDHNTKQFLLRLHGDREEGSIVRRPNWPQPSGIEDALDKLAVPELTLTQNIPPYHTVPRRTHAAMSSTPHTHPIPKRPHHLQTNAPMKRAEDQLRESRCTPNPILPTARPNSAINPFDCSPYLLQRPPVRVPVIEPPTLVKRTLEAQSTTHHTSDSLNSQDGIPSRAPRPTPLTGPELLEQSIVKLEAVLAAVNLPKASSDVSNSPSSLTPTFFVTAGDTNTTPKTRFRTTFPVL